MPEPWELKKLTGIRTDNAPNMPGAPYREKLRSFATPGLVVPNIVNPLLHDTDNTDLCGVEIDKSTGLQTDILKGIVVGVVVGIIFLKVIK